jgi:hypothetical protein
MPARSPIAAGYDYRGRCGHLPALGLDLRELMSSPRPGASAMSASWPSVSFRVLSSNAAT